MSKLITNSSLVMLMRRRLELSMGWYTLDPSHITKWEEDTKDMDEQESLAYYQAQLLNRPTDPKLPVIPGPRRSLRLKRKQLPKANHSCLTEAGNATKRLRIRVRARTQLRN